MSTWLAALTLMLKRAWAGLKLRLGRAFSTYLCANCWIVHSGGQCSESLDSGYSSPYVLCNPCFRKIGIWR